MMKKKWAILTSKKGVSLIELMVSMLISSIMLLMVVSSIGPVGKLVLRTQQLQLAQEIINNIAIELQTQVSDAIGYVKIYPARMPEDAVDSNIIGGTGANSGVALEYKNIQGYVELLSTDGCPETSIKRGPTVTGTASVPEKGRLLNRYYFQDTDGTTYLFLNTEGKPIARAVSNVFTDRFYMDHYLNITYSHPAGKVDGAPLTYIQAEIALYNKEEHLVAKESVVLDFRYKINRKDDVTAIQEAAEP